MNAVCANTEMMNKESVDRWVGEFELKRKRELIYTPCRFFSRIGLHENIMRTHNTNIKIPNGHLFK